jgi:hypothetical protein
MGGAAIISLLSSYLRACCDYKPTDGAGTFYVIKSAFHNNTVLAYLVQPSPNMLCRYQSQSRSKLDLYFVIYYDSTDHHRSAKRAL